MDLKSRFQFWFRTWSRIWLYAVRGFTRDRCSLRASAMSFYTIMSIVPLMAMAFGIAKGFGFRQFLENKVLSLFAGQEEAINTILTFSNNLLERTQGGLMAILGVVLLMYSLVKLMGHMENAFNGIWLSTADRSIIRKITDYITISMAAGLLIIFSGSGTIFITTHLEKFMGILNLPGGVKHMISIGFNISPFVSVWILFTFLYLFIPNKRVDVRAALAGGIASGTIFQIVQMLFVNLQVGVSNYNAIYGSFAALPVFLIWLQVAWTIILFGAEIAFAWENTDAPEAGDLDYDTVSIRMKKIIMLRIVLLCVKRFADREAPAADKGIASELNLPLRLVKILLDRLVDCGILFRVTDPETGYTPAMDIECLTVMDVVSAVEGMGREIPVGSTLEFEALEQSLERFDAAARASDGERNLKDI